MRTPLRTMASRSLAMLALAATSALHAASANHTRSFVNLSDQAWTVTCDSDGRCFSHFAWVIDGKPYDSSKYEGDHEVELVLPPGSFNTVTLKPSGMKFSISYHLTSSDSKTPIFLTADYPAQGLFSGPGKGTLVQQGADSRVKLNLPLDGDVTFAPSPKTSKPSFGRFQIINNLGTDWSFEPTKPSKSTTGSLQFTMGPREGSSVAPIATLTFKAGKTNYLRYATDPSGNCHQAFTLSNPDRGTYTFVFTTDPGKPWPENLQITTTTPEGVAVKDSWVRSDRFSQDGIL